MSKYEISSLYRTVRPRFMLYSPDGNGRDTYISYNNGGFWNKGISPKNERATSLEHGHKYVTRSHGMHVAPFKYYSDGLGRDSYILYQSGGLKRDSKALNEFHLKDFLRTPESCIFEFKKNQTKDGRIANTHYISQKQKEMNDYLSKNQRGVIQRLYDNERHKFIKNSHKSKSKLPNLGHNQKENALNRTDEKFFTKTAQRINNFEHNREIFNRTMSEICHIKKQR